MLIIGTLLGLLWLVDGSNFARSTVSLFIPLYAAIAVGVSIVLSAVSFTVRSKTQVEIIFIFLSYALLLVAAILTIFETGNTASPFIALWMLLAIFSGVFGTLGVTTTSVIALGYFAYLYMSIQQSNEQMFVYFVAFILPIFLSYLAWHKKSSTEHIKEDAYKTLARELSQVSSESDIVISAIADGVISINGKSVITLFNPAAGKMMGWQREDAIGLDYKSVLKLFNETGSPVDEQENPINRCFQTNETITEENMSLETNSGKKIIVSLVISPAGQFGSGAIIVFRDITAQKSEERQQAEFISTASHEMRTPVASIEGYLGLALNPSTAQIDDKARLYITKAHESAQHLGRLFQDLLDVSKAEDGRLTYVQQMVDVTSLARDVANGLIPMAQQKGISLIFKPDSSGIAQQVTPVFYAQVDIDHLRESLNNLVENAVKYTPQGSVQVDVTGDQDLVVVSIKDSGIGIPAEDIPHLFQKFYRVDSTDTREIGGTGLGLYLTRRLIEQMDGHVSVESEAGKGSTFSVQLKRIPNDEAIARLENTNNTLEQTPPPPPVQT